MKILLIEPPINCFTGLIKRGYPLGLCMLAGMAHREKIAEVKVYDVDKSTPLTGGLNFTNQRQNMANFLKGVNDISHPAWRQLNRVLEDFQPDMVGITSMTIQYASAMQTARIVKGWNPDCTVIMGGSHASVMPGLMIDWPYTDIVVMGEGEEVFVEIIKRLRRGTRDIESIPGVITKNHRDNLAAPPVEVEDLDLLPFPGREALLNPENYFPEDMGLVLTSRGCPYRCSYCSNFSRKTRFRSVENVLGEIVRVRKSFGTKQFMFKDDSFTLRRSRVEDFCRGIINRRIRILWEATTRLDLIDDDLVRLMKTAGCNRIGVGIESGDEEMLRIYNKRLTKEQIRTGTDVLNRNNIFWTGYFMMGLPMEREEQIYKTLTFMKETAPSYAALGVYKPYPGTGLFKMAEDLDLVTMDVTDEHFFVTNPVDYFFKDHRRRCAYISENTLTELMSFMEREFERYNKKLSNIAKRGFSRRKLYVSNYRSLLVDIRRAVKWMT